MEILRELLECAAHTIYEGSFFILDFIRSDFNSFADIVVFIVTIVAIAIPLMWTLVANIADRYKSSYITQWIDKKMQLLPFICNLLVFLAVIFLLEFLKIGSSYLMALCNMFVFAGAMFVLCKFYGLVKAVYSLNNNSSQFIFDGLVGGGLTDSKKIFESRVAICRYLIRSFGNEEELLGFFETLCKMEVAEGLDACQMFVEMQKLSMSTQNETLLKPLAHRIMWFYQSSSFLKELPDAQVERIAALSELLNEQVRHVRLNPITKDMVSKLKISFEQLSEKEVVEIQNSLTVWDNLLKSSVKAKNYDVTEKVVQSIEELLFYSIDKGRKKEWPNHFVQFFQKVCLLSLKENVNEPFVRTAIYGFFFRSLRPKYMQSDAFKSIEGEFWRNITRLIDYRQNDFIFEAFIRQSRCCLLENENERRFRSLMYAISAYCLMRKKFHYVVEFMEMNPWDRSVTCVNTNPAPRSTEELVLCMIDSCFSYSYTNFRDNHGHATYCRFLFIVYLLFLVRPTSQMETVSLQQQSSEDKDKLRTFSNNKIYGIKALESTLEEMFSLDKFRKWLIQLDFFDDIAEVNTNHALYQRAKSGIQALGVAISKIS